MTQGERAAAPRGFTLHAGCVLLGEAGILIRGPSGSGKSTLARRLVEGVRGRFAARMAFAAHVADDRVRLVERHGRLVARPVAAIAGRLEIRGIGLVGVAHEPAAVLRLVVDLADMPHERMPPAEALLTTLLGVVLPRLPVPADSAEAAALVMWRIRDLDDTMRTDR